MYCSTEIGRTENPIALVQLASSHTIALLHIHRWNWSSGKTFKALGFLKDILHDPNIKKLGVNISGDHTFFLAQPSQFPLFDSILSPFLE
jgi:hypothetical protein